MTSSLSDTLASWLRIDSVTPNETEFLEHMEREFARRGYTCSRQPIAQGRWNLLAQRSPPRLLFSTHVDTVPPHLPVRQQGDEVFGRGACDTKGGLLAMLRAADRLDHREVGFLLVVGEEVDHVGAKAAAASPQARPERIILCEPTRNRVVQAQKGMIKLHLQARGIAAHSAYPARGHSALHDLIRATHALLEADWPGDPERLGPTTLNVGLWEGGVAANVFAPQAEATVLIRTVAPTDDYRALIARCVDPFGVQGEIVVENDPVRFDPPGGVDTCTVAFNTDASYLGQIAPIWLVGPGDIEVAHTDQEHINLGALDQGIELYLKLATMALGL